MTSPDTSPEAVEELCIRLSADGWHTASDVLRQLAKERDEARARVRELETKATDAFYEGYLEGKAEVEERD